MHRGSFNHEIINPCVTIAEAFFLSFLNLTISCGMSRSEKVTNSIQMRQACAEVMLQVPIHASALIRKVDIKFKAEKVDPLHLANFVEVYP